MAYISTKEVAAIRGQLKEKFPQLKFSVRKQHYSSVIVTIKSGTVDFSDLVTRCYQDETIPFDGYYQTNQYWLDRMGKHQPLFEEIYKVIKTAPASVEGGREWFDDSDSMTDYFHTAFYFSVNVGSWDKPYVYSLAHKKPKAKNTATKTSKTVTEAGITVSNKATISDAAETVARMTAEEQDKFVEDIVSRYPNLADTLMTKLGYGLMEVEN